jgi:hypothetical protein
MLDHANHFPAKRETDFYLTRILGPKFAVLVALIVLYLSIRHQLITNLPATVVNLGLAHADAWVRLALAGDPDAITTFTNGHKSYRLTRFSIAHASLFIECWREVLWQIERGTIVAVALFAAPPLVWLNLCSAWDLWRQPAQQLQRASLPLPSAQAVDLAAREVLAPTARSVCSRAGSRCKSWQSSAGTERQNASGSISHSAHCRAPQADPKAGGCRGI